MTTAMPSNTGYGTLMANPHEVRHSGFSGSTPRTQKHRVHLSELCVGAVDPIGMGDLQPSTDAGLAPQLVSILDPALGFFQGETMGSIGGSEGSGVDDCR